LGKTSDASPTIFLKKLRGWRHGLLQARALGPFSSSFFFPKFYPSQLIFSCLFHRLLIELQFFFWFGIFIQLSRYLISSQFLKEIVIGGSL
jgi:hypothetical protein